MSGVKNLCALSKSLRLLVTVVVNNLRVSYVSATITQPTRLPALGKGDHYQQNNEVC